MERIGPNLSPAAKDLEWHIFDPVFGQRPFQLLSVEMRELSRTGKAADIGDRLNIVRPKQVDEFIQASSRMTDRP
jgi:hypothetical protein